MDDEWLMILFDVAIENDAIEDAAEEKEVEVVAKVEPLEGDFLFSSEIKSIYYN